MNTYAVIDDVRCLSVISFTMCTRGVLIVVKTVSFYNLYCVYPVHVNVYEKRVYTVDMCTQRYTPFECCCVRKRRGLCVVRKI